MQEESNVQTDFINGNKQDSGSKLELGNKKRLEEVTLTSLLKTYG